MLEKNDLQQIKEIVKEEVAITKKEINSFLEEFAVIVNKGFQEQKEYMDEKFMGIDKRFESVDKRFEGINEKFESVDKRFEGINEKFEGINSRLDRIEKELSAIRWDIADIKNRLEELERKIERMANAQTEDLTLMDGEINNLKKRIIYLEKQMQLLRARGT